MPQTGSTDSAARLRTALSAPASSARLQAALTAGSAPSPDYIDVLIEQCAIEPDFFVRDMLTWALIRNDVALVTEQIMADPEAGFDAAIMEAHRVVALRDAPIGPVEPAEATDSAETTGLATTTEPAETTEPADDAERALP